MMAFLLFNSAPRRILLLGLGGGSLAKYCYHRLPRSTVTVVEINPDVITLREEFHVPQDSDRFRVFCEDGAHYLARVRRFKDVILADACDRTGVAPQFDTLAFYQHAYRCLSRGGVFVSNLCGDKRNCTVHLNKLRTVFRNSVVTLQVTPRENLIVFAFKGRRPEVGGDKLAERAVGLSRKFALDFPRYAQRLAAALSACA